MSFDLYLLPADAIQLSVESARAFVDRENARFTQISESHGPTCEENKRQLAGLLLQLLPHYREFPINFDAIAKMENISAEDARLKYRWIEMNGRSQPADSQFIFFDNHVVVHWYSGTSADDMNAILYSLSVAGDFVVFDPQAMRVYDIRK